MILAVYVGLDEWVNGLIFLGACALVISRWDLNFHEEVNNDLALQGYNAGYFAPNAVPANDLVEQAEDFF